MKIVERLRKAAESIGCGLDDGGFTLTFDAKPGYVWDANGEPSLCIHYATSRESWLAQALKEELPNLMAGLSKVTDPKEMERIEFERGERWASEAGSPEHLDFPKNWRTL